MTIQTRALMAALSVCLKCCRVTVNLAVTTPLALVPCDRLACAQSRIDEQETTLVLAGFKDSREHLRSGVFRAAGRISDSLTSVSGQVEIFGAFDYERDLIRFDRSEPTLVATEDGASAIQLVVTGKFAQHPDKALLWTSYPGSPVLDITRPTEPSSPYVRPFDVRTLGVALWVDLEHGIPFDVAYGYLSESQWDQFVTEPEGRYRLSSLIGKPPASEQHRRTVWFDKEQGYSPVRQEVRRAVPSDRQAEPVVSSEVTWRRVSDTWVPEAFMIERRVGVNNVSRYDLRFKWESVNDHVSPSIFEPDGFGLAPNTAVVDNRLEKPIMLRVIGRPVQTRMTSGSVPRRWVAWVAPVSTAVVVGVLLILALKRKLSISID